MNYEEIKKIIKKEIEFKTIENLDKKAARATFETVIKYKDQEVKYYIELWADQLFLKMYSGPERAFFADDVFVHLVKEELTADTNVLANEIFVEIVMNAVVDSNIYKEIKKENPEFKL